MIEHLTSEELILLATQRGLVVQIMKHPDDLFGPDMAELNGCYYVEVYRYSYGHLAGATDKALQTALRTAIGEALQKTESWKEHRNDSA